MSARTRRLSVFLLLAAAAAAQSHAAAQNHTVSPPGFENQAGNASNTYPFFVASARYQQVHGQLRAQPMAVTAVSLRQAQFPVRSMPARTLDAELWFGIGDHHRMTTSFDANFLAPPTEAMARRQVQLPDWSQPPPVPAPWSASFPFDRPVPFPGGADLLWELRIHSTTHAGFYWTDAYAAQAIAEGPGGAVGSPCTATGMTTPVTFDVALQALRATNEHAIQATGLFWPVIEPGLVLIGDADPDLAVPGLCTRLRAAPVVLVHLVTGGRGSLDLPTTRVPFSPVLVGARLHLQAAVLDMGQPGVPLVLSHGWTGTVPDLPPPGHPVRRLQSQSVTATAGTLDHVSYGLITRFTH